MMTQTNETPADGYHSGGMMSQLISAMSSALRTAYPRPMSIRRLGRWCRARATNTMATDNRMPVIVIRLTGLNRAVSVKNRVGPAMRHTTVFIRRAQAQMPANTMLAIPTRLQVCSRISYGRARTPPAAGGVLRCGAITESFNCSPRSRSWYPRR